MADRQVRAVNALLDRQGRTFSAEAGIALVGERDLPRFAAALVRVSLGGDA
ncbi:MULTISPECIES: hypothetical protein [unclassified Micromonospora]|uniref:hypothetical protein n=1 Tax=unclassified Micromonospora TaxID=2617518 RepID=UPI003A86CDE2